MLSPTCRRQSAEVMPRAAVPYDNAVFDMMVPQPADDAADAVAYVLLTPSMMLFDVLRVSAMMPLRLP